MTTLYQVPGTNTIYQLVALLNDFPVGCDPDFDEGPEELERQFAELRLAFDHN